MTSIPPDPGSTVAERALQMVTALTAEVAVLRERLEVVELLGEKNGLLADGEVDNFRPDQETAQRFRHKRLALIDRVFRALRVRRDEAATP